MRAAPVGEQVPQREPREQLQHGQSRVAGVVLVDAVPDAMLFGIRPAGFADPAEAVATIHGGMRVLLRLLGELRGSHAQRSKASELDRELLRWAARRDDAAEVSPLVLRLGVLTWTRLHGIVSLELAGVFAGMEIDAGRLVEAEIQQAIDEATA